SLAASPAVGLMGVLSDLLFANTSLAQKIMVGAGPALAAVLCYRAAVRLTGRPGPSVVAASAYALSAVVLSASSAGRVGLLAALGAEVGASDPGRLGRLAFEDGPATWAPAVFLPVAALLGLALASGERRGPALRACLIAITGLSLAWLSAAGYLPGQIANAPVYVAMTATAEAFLVAFGLASAIGGLGREAFGFRQVGTAVLTVTLAVGILLQAVAAMTAEWAIGGPDRIPAAWAVVDSSSKGSFRVLWIGPDDGRSFPA